MCRGTSSIARFAAFSPPENGQLVNAFARLFHMPLLAKELTESAARPRTYWLRVVYGLLLFLIIGLGHGQFFRADSNPLSVLGEGRELFETLVYLQFVGIALFLPGLVAGRITQEKERDSLVLLLLTALTPRGIVLQKYLAGLVPMFSFLLLGLPLAAVAYAFGGFPAHDLALAALMLGLGCLQVGAIAIWCSARCRTTVSAFLATYLIGFSVYYLPLVFGAIAQRLWTGDFNGFSEDAYYRHFPPAAFESVRSAFGGASGWGELLKCTGAILGSTLFFLLLAPRHLKRGAAAPSTRRMQRLFALLDRIAERVNRLIGGWRVVQRAPALPEREPILWRERRSRLFLEPAHVTRVVLANAVPVMLLAAGTALMTAISLQPYQMGEQGGLSALAALFGTGGVLALSAVAANTFVSERVAQTLEVLLTTPLSAREIVRQKARALRPLMLVIAAPLLGVFAYEALLENIAPFYPPHVQRPEAESPWLYPRVRPPDAGYLSPAGAVALHLDRPGSEDTAPRHYDGDGGRRRLVRAAAPPGRAVPRDRSDTG